MAATEVARLERVIPGVGRIEYVESERRRDYWFTAEGNKRRTRLPSVTSILRQTWPKPALLEWYARLGREAETALESAANRGKAVHRFVEVYMATGELMDPADFPAEYAPYLRAAAAFLYEYDPRPLAVEQLVVHPEQRYAGRLDLIAAIHDVPTLLDFKSNTRGAVYPEAHVQATAYAIANQRCGGVELQVSMIVGLAEDGTFNIVPVRDATKLWGTVLAFFAEMRKFERALEGVATDDA